MLLVGKMTSFEKWGRGLCRRRQTLPRRRRNWKCVAEVEPADEAGPQSVSVVVPEGATPGTKLPATAPDGQELDLTVPEGVPASEEEE